MHAVDSLFSLFVAAAGWFYLFNSGASHRLADVEAMRVNAVRARLRRVGGAGLFVLAIGIYAGSVGIDADTHPRWFVFDWCVVLLLLLVVSRLALIDIRLTLRLKSALNRRDFP